MKTDNDKPEEPGYYQTVAVALIRLKQRLQQKYEQAYPDLRQVIPAMLDQEEKNAWELSVFPHLLLPGLIEGRIAELTCALAGEAAQTSPNLLVGGKSRTLGPLAQLEGS